MEHIFLFQRNFSQEKLFVPNKTALSAFAIRSSRAKIDECVCKKNRHSEQSEEVVTNKAKCLPETKGLSRRARLIKFSSRAALCKPPTPKQICIFDIVARNFRKKNARLKQNRQFRK